MFFIMKLLTYLENIFYTIKRKREDSRFDKGIKKGLIRQAKICSPDKIGEKISIFKPYTKEYFVFPRTFGFISNGGIEIEYPEVALWKFSNVMIRNNSDVIITSDNKAIWAKYFYYNYSKNITQDEGCIRVEEDTLSYYLPTEIKEVDCAFSMIGVFADIWAHNIAEYYPKLAVLKNAIENANRKIKVLVPEYKDLQVRQIIYEALSSYDVDVMIVHNGEAVKVNTLYYIERPTRFTDHETSVVPGDMAIPKAVCDYIKNNLVIPRSQNIKEDVKYSKLFLIRRGGFGKGIVNYEEIESFFERQGFVLVEPHKYTLEEKITMFKSAEIIVGPSGSAFTNMIFCKPGTKVLVFSNYQRIFDMYKCIWLQHFGIKAIYVTGRDDKSSKNMTHCSYYIPKDKVIGAAKELGII